MSNRENFACFKRIFCSLAPKNIMYVYHFKRSIHNAELVWPRCRLSAQMKNVDYDWYIRFLTLKSISYRYAGIESVLSIIHASFCNALQKYVFTDKYSERQLDSIFDSEYRFRALWESLDIRVLQYEKCISVSSDNYCHIDPWMLRVTDRDVRR